MISVKHVVAISRFARVQVLPIIMVCKHDVIEQLSISCEHCARVTNDCPRIESIASVIYKLTLTLFLYL